MSQKNWFQKKIHTHHHLQVVLVLQEFRIHEIFVKVWGTISKEDLTVSTNYCVNIHRVLLIRPLFPEETFLASGIVLTDSGQPQFVALDIEIVSFYSCRAAQHQTDYLLSNVWYIIDWAKSETWKHGSWPRDSAWPDWYYLNEFVSLLVDRYHRTETRCGKKEEKGLHGCIHLTTGKEGSKIQSHLTIRIVAGVYVWV